MAFNSSADNSVRNPHLCASPEIRAIFNDIAVPTVGRLELPTDG
jgi:hypothetical protein